MSNIVIKFERIARRGGDPLIRISIKGDIYTFENTNEIEQQLTRLLVGGLGSMVQVPADVVKTRDNK